MDLRDRERGEKSEREEKLELIIFSHIGQNKSYVKGIYNSPSMKIKGEQGLSICTAAALREISVCMSISVWVQVLVPLSFFIPSFLSSELAHIINITINLNSALQ